MPSSPPPLLKKKSQRTGIFGGSFNPPHLGHINLLRAAAERFGLSRALAVPAFKAPLSRGAEEDPGGAHRLEMLRLALAPLPFAEIDDQEIRRGGTSYTWRTVEKLSQKQEAGELFLIIGLDQLEIFDRWKRFDRILAKAHLIAGGRPGRRFPKKISDLPERLRPLVKRFSGLEARLMSDKKIYFCPLNEKKISSEEIRARLKKGLAADHLMPKSLGAYIRRAGLYKKNPRG